VTNAHEQGFVPGFDWLATLPMGAETLVSAGRSHLSAGQRQLLLLKALFASNYPVLLLDEASSQLDTGARERIRRDELARGRTLISASTTPRLHLPFAALRSIRPVLATLLAGDWKWLGSS